MGKLCAAAFAGAKSDCPLSGSQVGTMWVCYGSAVSFRILKQRSFDRDPGDDRECAPERQQCGRDHEFGGCRPTTAPAAQQRFRGRGSARAMEDLLLGPQAMVRSMTVAPRKAWFGTLVSSLTAVGSRSTASSKKFPFASAGTFTASRAALSALRRCPPG